MGLSPGDRVDRFTLVELLGEGGQASVWRATDPIDPDSRIAIKLVNMATASPQDAERVRQEARRLIKLGHPSLVACHGLFEDLHRDLLGIVMSCEDGRPLDTVVGDPRLTEELRLLVLSHVAIVLAYVHQQGVVHRDLKPANVLVTNQFWSEPRDPSTIKLIDFGIAVSPGAKRLTALGNVIGTPASIAPELLDIRQEKTKSVDVHLGGYGMREKGIDVFVHHSSVSLDERMAAEARFAQGINACIVCTSTLELGIDVGDLDYVLQANAPTTVSSFLQGRGRTGRRERTVANTTFLCEDPETVLLAVALIELAREGWVENVAVQDRCWPALVHQFLAMCLQYGAISAERCWEQLVRVPDFKGIRRDEYDTLIDHMKREDFLFEAGGVLSMGQKAEKVFGRRNFMDLYAVFSSPQLYRVVTEAGRDVGSLDQDFVDRLVEHMSSFLLGGQAWMVDRVSHDSRTIVAKKSPTARGVKPRRGGFMPLTLSFDVCQPIANGGRNLLDVERAAKQSPPGRQHLETRPG